MTELLRVSTDPNVTIRYRACLWRIMDGPHDGGRVLGLRTIKHDNDKSGVMGHTLSSKYVSGRSSASAKRWKSNLPTPTAA